MRLPSWLGLVASPLALVLGVLANAPADYGISSLAAKYLTLALAVLVLVVWHVIPPGLSLPAGLSGLLTQNQRAPPADVAKDPVSQPGLNP
ncbi:MAG: hypothetical protein KGJ86_00180 [Chloroflexota bacterium]|nr:hypothetical protein [Chloroflexota bacterium]